MRHRLLAVVLAAGVVLGYGSALASLIHHHPHHGGDHRPPWHCDDADPPAP